MTASENTHTRNFRTDLRKAESRERIAVRKLDRLKERFERLQQEAEEAKQHLLQAEEERERASQEARMWKTQLFERMELLEQTKDRLNATEEQLEVAWERAGQATLMHQADHEELKRRDRERLTFELQIEELKRAQTETKGQADDLLLALTDAESAIVSLQRSNDLYQRESDGLKRIGASLTEQLNRSTEQLERQRDYSASLQAELQAEKVHTEHLRDEIQRLSDELYQTNDLLVSYQRESDRLEGRAVVTARTQETPPAASTTTALVEQRGTGVLSRATRRMSGWFRLKGSSKPKKS